MTEGHQAIPDVCLRMGGCRAGCSVAVFHVTGDCKVGIDRRGGEHGFYYNGVRQYGFPDFKTDIRLHQWTNYCHVFSSGHYTAYVQGKERVRGKITTNIIPLALNSTLTLGQEQDLLAGAFDVEQIFRGFISGVNIWNRSLTRVEVEEQAGCSTAPLGNIFSTDRDELELFNVLETLERPEVFCAEEARYVIFPEPRYIEDSILLCKRMGYKVFSPSTHEKTCSCTTSPFSSQTCAPPTTTCGSESPTPTRRASGGSFRTTLRSSRSSS
ncbi:putative neuronal pentraxin-1 isoform X2 [Penaeus vannamei]|uniref:Putative neuronal pentraxin-1 isoform X2 n=1 Tax=Penaeus vannamei TaxID=6689 RepID=A0A423SAL2_PENVA|nr:putative neuronal pentraxin-1 isoform X2 [Penaeus vannamei]